MASNEKMIWDLLLAGIGNPYGAAAAMGNLRAESSLNPMNMTGTKAKQWKSGNEYVSAVNSGTYDQYSFAHDGIAFGLVQWCYWSRKQGLHEFAKGLDISDAKVQIDYMLKEVSTSYKTVWNALVNATEINTPCDIFMLKYEKPGTTTEAAKQKRRDFAAGYFDKYYEEPVKPAPAAPVFSEPVQEPKKPELPKIRQVVTTASGVRARTGNGMDFPIVTKIATQGTSYPWVATSENNWHAINIGTRVVWVSGAFSKVVEG